MNRVLAGLRAGRALSLAEHLSVHGPLPRVRAGDLIEAVDRAGLTGRGGAAFPTARKLAAVAERSGAKVVVANGVEAEPMSAKDRVLLTRAPHLVLDGARAAADAVGARDVVVCVPAAAQAAVSRALAERDDLRARVQVVPGRYLAGEESALVNHLNGGPLKPTFTPPRPFERGVRRRPTLVQNVETLAQLALVARHGPDWFRAAGTPAAPGTLLVTVTGAVREPGVLEVPSGTPVRDALDRAGGVLEAPGSIIVGGYFGAWLPAAQALALTLDPVDLAPHEAALGAGALIVLPASACAVSELARALAWLAAESAHQCGPCANGLPAIARGLERMRSGNADESTPGQVLRWAGLVRGRGACHHPDGAVRLLRTALRTLDADLRDHARHGPCDACHGRPLLATPSPYPLAA